MKVPISDFAVIDLEAPVLPAFEFIRVDDSVRWLVWCRYCQDWHEHGAQEGHRIAHCFTPGSPYLKTGYNLSLRGEWVDLYRPKN